MTSGAGAHVLCFSPPGIGSKQENGKVFSITNVVRFRVERRDHGSVVTCEATHPTLRGQRKETQYVLDVQCK